MPQNHQHQGDDNAIQQDVLLRLLHLLALKCGKMVHGNHIIQHLQQTGNIG